VACGLDQRLTGRDLDDVELAGSATPRQCMRQLGMQQIRRNIYVSDELRRLI
jgi:hypothetical protein